MIRDKIVFSTENPALKEWLIRDPKLDLQKAVDISRCSELAHKDFVSMKGAARMEGQQVEELNSNRLNTNQASTGGKQSRSRGRGARNGGRRQSCRRCGTTHARNECPAWGKSCLRCGGPNHFSSQCRTVYRNVNEMVDQGGNEDEFFVDCLYAENISTKESSA